MQNQQRILDTVMKKGVLFSTSISYWRAHKHLRPEDIGFEAAQINQKLISLGHKKLVPPEALQEFSLVEGRVNAFVANNSFPFMQGVGRYVPNTALPKVIAEMQARKQEFWDAFARFKASYTTIRRQAQADWLKAAQDLSADPLKLVETIDKAYPAQDELERYFDFKWGFFQIAFPEEVDAEVLLQESEEVAAARREAAKQAKEQMLGGVGGFVSECVNQMRADLAELAGSMQSAIEGSAKGVHQKTLNRLTDFIAQYRLLNFANDTTLEEELTRFQTQFLDRTAEHYRGNAADQASLLQGLQGLRSSALGMIKSGTSNVLVGLGRLGVRRLHMESADATVSAPQATADATGDSEVPR